MSLSRLLTASLLSILATTASIAADTPVLVAVRAGHLIAPDTSQVLDDQLVVISGERVKEVGPAAALLPSLPAGTKVIDLTGSTVMPGFIDCHTHVTGQPENYMEDLFRKSPIDEAIVAHVYALRTLEAGFTSVRNVGADNYVDVALRNAINAGKIPGPRMQVSGPALSSTGGHGDLNGMSPNVHIDGIGGVANGVDEIRKKVRENVKYGADLIKFHASAGVLSEEESVGAPQYSPEEMKAVVDEAKMWGRRVAAHAHGAEAIKLAVRAGVTSIEHGSLLDAEGIQLMKEHGTWLVADIYDDDYILAEYSRLGFPEKTLAKERLVGRLQRENFRKAAQAGVKIAYGTDSGVYPHGWNGKQFAKMVDWGLTPLQAIQSATTSAAELMGWEDRVGRLRPGYFADLVAVPADPLNNIALLESPTFVMKGGAVVKDATTVSAVK